MTAPTTDHVHASGWGGAPGQCGASCSCGETYDGFDTLGEAVAMLDAHIVDSLPEPTQGHLPAGADECRCHPGERHWCSKRPTPTLAEHVAEAQRLADELITALARQYDPETVPAVTRTGSVPIADMHLSYAVTHVQLALARLQKLTELCAPTQVSA